MLSREGWAFTIITCKLSRFFTLLAVPLLVCTNWFTLNESHYHNYIIPHAQVQYSHQYLEHRVEARNQVSAVIIKDISML